MLGHIAIAAMGGYFAQDRTGKVIDTYHPTRCVPMRGVHWHNFTRTGGTSEYDKVFTETYAFSKVIFQMPISDISYPTILLLGTQAPGRYPRTWVSGGASIENGGQFEIRHEETCTALAPYEIAHGALVAETYRGDPCLRLSRLGAVIQAQPILDKLFETAPVYFRVGYSKAVYHVDFFADVIENDSYDYHWFRQAMKTTDGKRCATFEHFTQKALVEL